MDKMTDVKLQDIGDITFEIEKSPYGDTGAVYKGALGMMNHFRLQLISFRKLPKTADERKYLETDISGYEEILKSGSEKNAQEFMKLKQDRMLAGAPYANNVAVIDALKKKGLWQNG